MNEHTRLVRRERNTRLKYTNSIEPITGVDPYAASNPIQWAIRNSVELDRIQMEAGGRSKQVGEIGGSRSR